MWNKISHHISNRLAVLLTLLTLVILSINATIVFNRTYQDDLFQSRHNVTQLVGAVANTAAISVYVRDTVLASEVVDGLSASDLISAVALRANSETISEQGSFIDGKKNDWIHFPLYAPFDKDELTGELIVQANDELIASYANKAALQYVMFMAIHSLILIMAVVLLLNYQLVRVIRKIASSLHDITPGSNQRIQVETRHKNDEIGMLASDINQLLTSVETTLTRERTLREEVENLERRFRSIFEQASGGIALLDQNSFLKVHNPSFATMLGDERMQRLTSTERESLAAIIESETNAIQNAITQALNEDGPISLDIKLGDETETCWVHCLIAKMQDDSNNAPLLQIIMQDVSERRFREQSFQVQAELDPLTGLFNRRAGKAKIQQLLDDAVGTSEHYALLMLDLDNFKPVNDNFGHDAGDRVLMRLAEELRNTVRSGDVVIRWGGDEFLVFIKQINYTLEVGQIAEKLLKVIQRPIPLDNQNNAQIGVSIGVAIFPDHGFDLELLTQRADQAMYQVKLTSKDGYAFYNDVISEKE
ncbi:MAG: diguanylate cyclase [Gammaproteobacteria bacterium]|nr:diguanylate cyclase [Gammaproteobacteria bacterium]